MLWEAIRELLFESLPESEYSLWIKPLTSQMLDEQTLQLAGPDRFFCSWIKDRYLNLIQEKSLEVTQGRNINISLTVVTHPSLKIDSDKAGQLRLPGVHGQKQQIRSLHPAYTFEQFMVGQSNVLARSACHALASGEKTFGNFLFINSSTGLGKSHLTQAVVHSVLDKAPSTMLHYLTAQQFSSEMVNGIRNKSMDKFSKKFLQHCDMLLVEDVHTLIGKNKTQDELNTILDYLIKSGKRVILTSAVAPGKLDGIDEDFRSRMTSGLITRIESPDYGTRVNIIRHKARVNSLPLGDSLVDLLAQHLNGDIRKTESAIMGIKAKSNLLDTPPDKTIVMEVLRDIVGTQAKLDGETIRSFVGTQFKVSVDQLKSKSRKRSIAYPRQIGMYMTRKFTDQSLADIGELYKRDHSTVLHAIKVINREMARKTSVNEQIQLLSKKLQNL